MGLVQYLQLVFMAIYLYVDEHLFSPPANLRWPGGSKHEDSGLPLGLPRAGPEGPRCGRAKPQKKRKWWWKFRRNPGNCKTYGCVWKWLVPLNPMVLLIIIPFLNGDFIGGIPHFQTNPYSFPMFSLEINYNNKVPQKSTGIDFVVYNCWL